MLMRLIVKQVSLSGWVAKYILNITAIEILRQSPIWDEAGHSS